MDKRLIAGAAILFLSSGVALAQSDMHSRNSNGNQVATQDSQSADTSTAHHRKIRADGRYSRGESRVNQAEAEETRELNREEAQQVASNGGGNNAAGADRDQDRDGTRAQERREQP